MAVAKPQKLARFSEICHMIYKDQAIWFLNGYWGNPLGPNEANEVWKIVEKFAELDTLTMDKKGANGCELDVFWSAKFLENMNQTMTALARKDALRAIDADSNGFMSALEYLIWKWKKGVDETVDSPQGTSPELEEAQKALRKVQQALAEVRRLQEELRVAVEDLKKQEEAYANRIKVLEAKASDASASLVSRNKAAAELAQVKGEDPLPLRKAKLTQEAALRKVQKQEDKLQQELADAQQAVDRARATSKGGAAPGLIWWMQRELFESDKNLAKAKQKYDHSKPFLFDPLK
jgi:small-conductance mechanosensitive channel